MFVGEKVPTCRVDDRCVPVNGGSSRTGRGRRCREVSHLVEVPQAVHSPLEGLSRPGPCGQSVVTDFLDHPDTAPDADCAADFALQPGNPLPARFG